MIKNLNQLKKTLVPGTRFEITEHCRPECVGQLREVTVANTQGFYSIIPDEPDHKVTLGNNGRGSFLHWSKAPFWSFTEGECTIYSSDRLQSENQLILSFKVLEPAAAEEL